MEKSKKTQLRLYGKDQINAIRLNLAQFGVNLAQFGVNLAQFGANLAQFGANLAQFDFWVEGERKFHIFWLTRFII